MLLELGRMVLSLCVVLGLLWVIARVGRGRQAGRRLGRGAGHGSAPDNRIEVLGRRSVGRHSAVLIIRTKDRTMVVGQTPQQINVLAECEWDQPEAREESVAAGCKDTMPRQASDTGALTPKAWDAVVDRLREMTVRH